MEQAVNTRVVMVLFKSDGERRDFRLRKGICVIGRQPDCDLQAPDTRVSRHHCQVHIDDDGRVFVKDLGSSNGTFVNDERLTEEVELAAGDRLAVGGFVFTVQINGEPEEIEPPLFDAPSASGARAAMGSGSGSASGAAETPAHAPTRAATPRKEKKDSSSESSVAGIDDLIDAAIAETHDDDSVDDEYDDDGSSVIEFDPDKDS